MSVKRVLSIFLVILCTISFSGADIALAAKKKNRKTKRTYNPIQTSLVIDGKSGKILHASNAKKQVYPASLTKLATLYLIFEALESGKLKMNQRLKVSKYAASAIPLKLGLKAGETITVQDIILGIIVRSANDASRVAAEALAGSEEKFAKLMTKRAKSLGMKNTTFANSDGLHNPKQKTTAIDLAKLTVAIKSDFPQYYHFFSKTSFNFRGKEIKGHNKVTANYPGAEGMKTGFTNASGCNLITTATRGSKHLIGIVTGGKTAAARNQKMTNLLDAYFGPNTKGYKSNSQKEQSKIAKGSSDKITKGNIPKTHITKAKIPNDSNKNKLSSRSQNTKITKTGGKTKILAKSTTHNSSPKISSKSKRARSINAN